jgi:hypothetical protein
MELEMIILREISKPQEDSIAWTYSYVEPKNVDLIVIQNIMVGR